jgi:MFS family permease
VLLDESIFAIDLGWRLAFGLGAAMGLAYLIPFGIANFAGALLLGRLFDTVGRRPMIVART